VAGIVGMAAALEAASKDRERFTHDVEEARRRFETRLVAEVPGAALTVPGTDRLVQHSHFRIDGVDAETLLIRLDAAGVAAAAGSACHSGAIEVSHVLAAMGMGVEDARSSVRFTFGWTIRPGDGDAAADALVAAVEGLR
jgi:cysteine desulfurase